LNCVTVAGKEILRASSCSARFHHQHRAFKFSWEWGIILDVQDTDRLPLSVIGWLFLGFDKII